MNKIIMLFLLLLNSCAGEEFFEGGIQALWNGRYNEEGSGEAFLNVGTKELDIQSVGVVPSNVYYLESIIQQETRLQAWLTNASGQFVPIQMVRANLNDRETTISISGAMERKGQFPSTFETNLSMLRF